MNERQHKFVAAYLRLLDAAAAAREAGYRREAAGRAARRLLRSKEVAAAIAKAEAARAASRRVTADRVLEEYARIAFADMRAFADWGPRSVTLRDKALLSDWDAGAIAELEPPRGNGASGRLKLYDKKAALDALARHTGLFDPHRSLGRKDQSMAGKEARAIILERLDRLAKKNGS